MEGAWRIAVEVLDIDRESFERCSPMELAWRLWGARRRANARSLRLAWAVSTLASVHVDRKDRSALSVRKLFFEITGGDLDKDEML